MWLVSLSTCLCGCDLYKTYKCPSYVVAYNSIQSIELSNIPSVPSGILIGCGNERPIVLYTFKSSGEEKDRYDWLCQKHNDLNFNQYYQMPAGALVEGPTFNDKDFSSIGIVSDQDYDASHPAGTDLSDIVRFMSWSPLKYIRSGYSSFYHYDPQFLSDSFKTIMPLYFSFQSQTDATCYPIDKMISALEADDLILLGNDSPGLLGILSFETPPAEQKERTITVRMTADTGEVFEDSIQITL